MADKVTYPMIPEKSWWVLREQFKKTIPSTVNVSYLKSLLGLTSDQAARNIISPLRQLRIIDENDKPTPRANEWRNDSKYGDLCATLVKEIYPQELLDLFPEPSVDTSAAKLWFMDTGSVGDSAAAKIVALFSLLKAGEVKTDFDTSKSVQTTQAKSKPSPKPSLKSKSNPTISLPSQPEAKEVSHKNTTPTLHIDLQIHISPEASPEQIDAIFSSVAKHLYKN